MTPYPYTARFRPNCCYGDSIHLHHDQGNIRHSAASSVLILGQDLKGCEIVVLPTVFSNDISAGTHKVKGSPIESAIVRISHGPAGTKLWFHWFGDTGGRSIFHLTHLVWTAGDTAAGQRSRS